MADHPTTPPTELVQQWVAEIWHEGTPVQVSASDIHIATQATRWGADQELEACCKLLELSDSNAREFLTAARRPKPPSLKERALQAWVAVEAGTDDQAAMAVIRRALEALDD